MIYSQQLWRVLDQVLHVVGTCYGYPCNLQIFDVDTKSWRVDKFKTNEGLTLWPKGQPVAVDKKLYQYDFHFENLSGFDLVTNKWIKTKVHMHDRDEYVPGKVYISSEVLMKYIIYILRILEQLKL